MRPCCPRRPRSARTGRGAGQRAESHAILIQHTDWHACPHMRAYRHANTSWFEIQTISLQNTPYLEIQILAIRVERNHVHGRIVRIVRKAENRTAVGRKRQRRIRRLRRGRVHHHALIVGKVVSVRLQRPRGKGRREQRRRVDPMQGGDEARARDGRVDLWA